MTPVEIGVEVEATDLQPLDLTGHRWTATQIGDARMPGRRSAKIDAGFDRIDAEGGPQIIAEANIGGGESELPAALIAVLDPALDFPRPSQQSSGAAWLAGLQRLADSGR